ncbi:MAG: PorP/SprF family type IX secretion system membrane protein [Cytophagaceae bacterium]
MSIIKQVRYFFTGVLLLGMIMESRAQDAAFSQYYASALYLNPALTGIQPYVSFSSNNRTQWRSIVLPYVTNQISLIAPLYTKDVRRNHVGGIGFSFYNDRAGESNFKTNGFNVNAAYNLPLTASRTSFLTFGLQGGFIQKSIDFTNLQWGQQFNPYIGVQAMNVPDQSNVKANKMYPDISTGMMFNYNSSKDYSATGFSGYAGIAAYHINRPNESLVKGLTSTLPVLYKAHLGFEVHAGKRINISPNALFIQQKNLQQINGGLYLTYLFPNQTKVLAPNFVTFGSWYRLKDAFIFSTGFGNDHYTLGFSYDYNTSSLRFNTQGRGAYEISLSIRRVKANTASIFHTPRI